MDKTLLMLTLLSGLLISLVAPLATVTVATILSLSVLFTWGSWTLLKGVGQSQPATQRVWD